MDILFDAARLTQLADGFYALCGVPAGALGADGRELCPDAGRAPFCALVRAGDEGPRRCRDCAARLAQAAGDGGCARCHAGALVALLPLRAGDRPEPMARLFAGPFLDASLPLEDQWRAASAALDWFSGDRAALRRAFFALRPLSPAERRALDGALELLAGHVLRSGLILPAGEGDSQRLARFLDEHYMEKLTLASISERLHIGRTRLCALAKQLSGGQTLSAMIARRRIGAAKELLIRTDRPVSAIAEAVGVSDYNYFSKIFRTAVGVSPSEFRKRARIELDTLD